MLTVTVVNRMIFEWNYLSTRKAIELHNYCAACGCYQRIKTLFRDAQLC